MSHTDRVDRPMAAPAACLPIWTVHNRPAKLVIFRQLSKSRPHSDKKLRSLSTLSTPSTPSTQSSQREDPGRGRAASSRAVERSETRGTVPSPQFKTPGTGSLNINENGRSPERVALDDPLRGLNSLDGALITRVSLKLDPRLLLTDSSGVFAAATRPFCIASRMSIPLFNSGQHCGCGRPANSR